jgi:hypothetical protein
VVRLRGTVTEEFTLARRGAERLRKLLAEEDAVTALGALTGNQAVQQVKAGLQAIYLSGWQVAADANLAGQTYPDQSLYPVNSVPQVVRRINNALLRADQIAWSESEDGDTTGSPYWLAPIVADAEAGFGGVLNAFELMKAMIAAGAAGVHWEDQLASEKKCGHLGGKVLIPTGQHVKTLNAARLAADVYDVPTLIIARTDAQAATLLTADIDERDQPFVTGERTAEGFYRVRQRDRAVHRPRPGLRAVLRPALDGDVQARPRRGPRVRRGHQERLPGPDARLQLLALVQLARAPGRGDHRQVQQGTRRDGLPVPVHHPGRLPRPQPLDVRPGQGLRRGGHARLRPAPAGRVRGREVRLHRHPPPARGRHRLLRPGDLGDLPNAETVALSGSTEAEQFHAA